MPALWIAGGSALLGGLSGFFGQRGANKQAEKLQKNAFRENAYFTDLARKDALEARQYKEKAIGSYRPFATAGLASPDYTDPNTINPVKPYG